MIQIDTREQENSFIIDFFNKHKIEYCCKKLDVGDYCLQENPNFVIERKKDLLELSGNICSSDHERFRNELLRGMERNIKIIVVVGDPKIKSLKGVKFWNGKPFTEVKGEVLAKAMATMEEKYNVKFMFESKEKIPILIYNLLVNKGEETIFKKVDDYIKWETIVEKVPKITGTKFPVLIGENPYKKKGDEVLEMLKLVKREEIDPYYTIRGEIGEAIARQIFESNGYECITWDKIKVGFDNFPTNETFGGLIDIAIKSPIRRVVEVKTKSLKDYDRISKYGNTYEELQGMLYSFLSKSDIIMIWIFLNEETEHLIKSKISKGETVSINDIDINGVGEFGERNLTVYMKEIPMDEKTKNDLSNKMYEASSYLEWCYEYKMIPIKDISENVLAKLKIEV